MKITVVSGSPRKESITVRVAKHLLQFFKEKYPAHEVQFVNLQESHIPFVEKVWSTLNDVPEEFKEVAEKIYSADAFVVVTPEYNGSMSAAARNLFDHFPKQNKKVFGIVTASDGAMGGIRAAVSMQNQICAWFGIPCPQMLVVGNMSQKFDVDGKLTDEKFSNNILNFTTEFVWLAEAVTNKKQGQ
jgi:NAD(P)H-dependent FMN reductase